MREDDTWWCVTDEDVSKSEDSLMKLRFFKKFGKEYIKNEDGRYELKEHSERK